MVHWKGFRAWSLEGRGRVGLGTRLRAERQWLESILRAGSLEQLLLDGGAASVVVSSDDRQH